VLNAETAKSYEKSQQPVSRPRFETDTFRTRLQLYHYTSLLDLRRQGNVHTKQGNWWKE